MNVLVVSQHFWPESFRINALVHALEEGGARVTVLTGQPNYPEGKVFPGYSARRVVRERFGRAVDVVRVPMLPRGPGGAARLVANYVSFIASASLLAPFLLRRARVDVVFVYATSPVLQAIPALLLGRLRGVPVVTWVQDLWPESLETTGYITDPTLLTIVEGLVRRIYASSDLVMGQSRAFVSAIAPLAADRPVEYFPNPGEAEDATPSETPAITLPAGFNVVFTGNLGTVQALETVIEAATLLRDEPGVRFVLVGSGSRAAWTAAEVARRGLTNVLMPGRFDVSAMPGIMAQASALLVSLNRGRILSQTLPSKLQTYLAAGRPILASLDGEGAELVTSAGAGLASPAEDARGLADNVRRLARMSAAERERLGSRARSFYDLHFRPDALARQLLERFRALTSNHQ